MEFRELLNTPGPVLLDGGMGTMLQARGLSMGEWPELAALFNAPSSTDNHYTMLVNHDFHHDYGG